MARSQRKYSAGFVAQQFKPGQSGNPNGNRGSAYGECLQLARSMALRALQRLGELAESEDERIALMASSTILDRAYGKPAERPPEDDPDTEITEERSELLESILKRLDRRPDHDVVQVVNRTNGFERGLQTVPQSPSRASGQSTRQLPLLKIGTKR